MSKYPYVQNYIYEERESAKFRGARKVSLLMKVLEAIIKWEAVIIHVKEMSPIGYISFNCKVVLLVRTYVIYLLLPHSVSGPYLTLHIEFTF